MKETTKTSISKGEVSLTHYFDSVDEMLAFSRWVDAHYKQPQPVDLLTRAKEMGDRCDDPTAMAIGYLIKYLREREG